MKAITEISGRKTKGIFLQRDNHILSRLRNIYQFSSRVSSAVYTISKRRDLGTNVFCSVWSKTVKRQNSAHT